MNAQEKNIARKKALLLGGGYFSLACALFQFSGIFWPPDAIRYFGGPADFSRTQPVLYTLLCIVVAAIVAVFGLYALSGAGRIRRLPLLRTVLLAATAIYIFRGLLLIPQIPVVIQHPNLARFLLFSMLSLCIGFAHLAGLSTLFHHENSSQ